MWFGKFDNSHDLNYFSFMGAYKHSCLLFYISKDPGLSREHFKFAARRRIRARGRGEIGRAGVYVSKCLQERPWSV